MSYPLDIPLTLGDTDWFRIIIFVVIAAFWVIGSIAKTLQDQKQEQSKRDSSERPSAEPTNKARSVRERLNELAERRRRQLQEMAREKQQNRKAETSRPTSQRELTGSERELTGSKRELTETTRAPDADETEARRRAAEQRAEQLRRAAEQAQRDKQEARRRQQAETERRKQIERQRMLQQAAKRRGKRQTKVHPGPPGHPDDEAPVHRHVPDLPSPIETEHQVHPDLVFTRQGLRQAIIMKEILDKPLALRDSQDFTMEY